MTVTLIGYSDKNRVRIAGTYLTDNFIDYRMRDVRKEEITPDELNGFIGKSGRPLWRFINFKSETYKSLDTNMEEFCSDKKTAIDLLANDNSMISLPILVSDSSVLVGFNRKLWDEILLPERTMAIKRKIDADIQLENVQRIINYRMYLNDTWRELITESENDLSKRRKALAMSESRLAKAIEWKKRLLQSKLKVVMN